MSTGMLACRLVLAPLAIVLLSDAHAQTAAISLDEAKALIGTIDEVARETERNSSCLVQESKPFSASYEFYLLTVSCTPAKDDAGLLRMYFVNKVSGDVRQSGEAGVMEEPSLGALQESFRAKHQLSPEAVHAAHGVEPEGCLYL